MNRTLEKIFDVLYLFASFFMIGLLIFLLYYSLVFFNEYFPVGLQYSMGYKMYYVGVGIAIVTSATQWIEGRIKSIISTYRNLKGGNDGREREGKKE